MWSLASFAQDAPPQPPGQQQPPAQTQPPADQQPTQGGTMRVPPPPPKVIDVRQPGEKGWFIGVTGWVPVGSTYMDKGQQAAFTGLSNFKFPGQSKGQVGGELGVAVGQHNLLRFSYMTARAAGTSIAPNDLVLYSTVYNAGDQLATGYKLSDYKMSYEYLTWPYPVGARRFRLMTLWQMQYITMKTHFDAPVRSNTPDAAGNLFSYAAAGSKSFFSPTLGIGVREYVTGNFRVEANVSGFALPHRFNIWDADASINYRIGKIEVGAGGRALHFRTSFNSDYYHWGTFSGAFVAIRWYAD
ncbi:MAG: hypothetical protein JST11_19740 [Acidobacteria bacterium]|nr:hypothetical protein [Acidobacteriota bacterium]